MGNTHVGWNIGRHFLELLRDGNLAAHDGVEETLDDLPGLEEAAQRCVNAAGPSTDILRDRLTSKGRDE